MTNFNQTPFLPSQLDFPVDQPKQLGIVLDKAYLDTAARINERTIGIYSTVSPIIIGDAYYLSGGVQGKQIAQRKVFSVSTTAAALALGFSYKQVVRLYGTWTDGTGSWYGFIAGTPAVIPSQIVISLTANQLIFTVSGVAPVLTSGLVVVEYV